MDPAYPIPLSTEQLALLGELTAILGQIDEQMVETVSGLAATTRQIASLFMGSSKISDNSAIWAALIRERTRDPEILRLVDLALIEIPAVSGARNDYIHAYYLKCGKVLAFDNSTDVAVFTVQMGTFAKRVRNGKLSDVNEIQAIRDRAARLSCLVAHIGHTFPPFSVERPMGSPSPWLERLAPTLPPHPDKDAPLSAKGRPRPPQSSPG